MSLALSFKCWNAVHCFLIIRFVYTLNFNRACFSVEIFWHVDLLYYLSYDKKVPYPIYRPAQARTEWSGNRTRTEGPGALGAQNWEVKKYFQ